MGTEKKVKIKNKNKIKNKFNSLKICWMDGQLCRTHDDNLVLCNNFYIIRKSADEAFEHKSFPIITQVMIVKLSSYRGHNIHFYKIVHYFSFWTKKKIKFVWRSGLQSHLILKPIRKHCQYKSGAKLVILPVI